MEVSQIDVIPQERQLLLFDSKALYHILVKDQYIYEEAPAFIMYVSAILKKKARIDEHESV